MGIRDIEFVENPEPRCPVVLLLDTSNSMGGSPLRQLNESVEIFRNDIASDAQASLRVELAIISFGGTVRLVRDFVAVHEWRPSPLVSAGDTPMGEAIEMGLRLLEERKIQYKQNGIYYYRPWVWLLTDGEPTDGERWRQAAQLVHAGEDRKAFSFFAVGVKGANFDVLRQIAPSTRKPIALKGLKFHDMFLWLSASMKRVSTTRQGEQLALPPIEGWAEEK
jgi:uncharacterized protein YegL